MDLVGLAVLPYYQCLICFMQLAAAAMGFFVVAPYILGGLTCRYPWLPAGILTV
jgi:hypothetical protein